MNIIYEKTLEIAQQKMDNEEICTFEELGKLLNLQLDASYSGGRGVAKVVSEAYHYAYEKYGEDAANIIATVYRNSNGEKAY